MTKLHRLSNIIIQDSIATNANDWPPKQASANKCHLLIKCRINIAKKEQRKIEIIIIYNGQYGLSIVKFCFFAAKTLSSIKVEKSHTAIPALKWGRENENNAIKQYMAESVGTHVNLEHRCAGLSIDINNPFLGASPDGVISWLLRDWSAWSEMYVQILQCVTNLSWCIIR